MKNIRVIVTGSTGMVGEGVLHVCLENPLVEEVLVINRHSVGIVHPKLKEIIHDDFLDLSPIETRLKGYDACFFCLGISSVGADPQVYYTTTYLLTMHVARVLARNNAGMVFCYVSGSGTDSAEKSPLKWARIKGKTENELSTLPFRAVYRYRPALIRPYNGQKHAHGFYRSLDWLFPFGLKCFPTTFCTMEDLALSMIRLTLKDSEEKLVDGRKIARLAADLRTFDPELQA